MDFRSIAISLFSILFLQNITAQNSELGKVTIEELKEKVHPKDSSAPAAILFKKGSTTFNYVSGKGFVANNVYEFKIKIYKPEGLTWANQKVSYYIGYENLSDETVSFSNAATYNLENGKIVKTKLNSEGSFKTKINKYWSQAAITLPNVKVGSVIEYKYVLKSENLVKLPDFEFQYNIPVNFFEYKTEIPEFFIYKTLYVGNIKIDTKADVVGCSQLNFQGYKQINARFTSADIPALKEERFVDNMDNYRGAIRNELERKRFPDEPVVNYTTTWEEVAKTIYKNESFGKELNEKDYFAADLKQILQNKNTEQEKLNAVFSFVQTKMSWNKEKGYFTDNGVKKAYLNQTGNVAEINFILVSMLRVAGISANPVLVSTIENGVSVFPSRTDFNYVIASAEIAGEKFLLDATNKFTVPNILPLNLLNWKGRLIKNDGSTSEIDLIPVSPSKSSNTIRVELLPDSGKLQGSLSLQKADYEALSFREKYGSKSNESNTERLENELSGIEIEDYKIENQNQNLSKPVLEKVNFSTNKAYDIIGGKIFLNPLLFFTYSSNPFKLEQRQMPIYFGYPEQKKYSLFLQIPEGYQVEFVPTPLRIVMEDRGASYTMNTMADEHQVQIIVTQEINKAIFATSDYDMIRDFFQKIIEIQNNKIILKKV